MDSMLYSIGAVSERTGLSPHVIRVWEKRYAAVEPERTDTNRRLYSEKQVERLELLAALSDAGHSIGRIARLPIDELQRLKSAITSPVRVATFPRANADEAVQAGLSAVRRLDARGLEGILKRASVTFGAQGLLQKVIGPMGQQIGELWRQGTITAAHEHFATAVLRAFLGHTARPFAAVEQAPVLVVATPSGQLHELGGLMAGAAAANVGWHVTYLGASLPATEIAGAARQSRARAVALSMVYPEDDPRLEGELTLLRELLSEEVEILVGGRATASYKRILEKIGAKISQDLSDFTNTLDALRKTTSPVP